MPIDAYEATVRLIKFFRRRGLLVSIRADGSPEEVLERTLAALKISPTARNPVPI